MATKGQYQSFALIAYNAIDKQLQQVNASRNAGCDFEECYRLLYLAKNVNDVVFDYSRLCFASEGIIKESDIQISCDWLMTNLQFTISGGSIEDLAETTINNPPIPIPPSLENFLLQDNGFYILQDDGFRIIINNEPVPPLEDFLLQDDGFYILQDNGFRIIINNEPIPLEGYLLQDDGNFILQDNGFKIIINN
jgi:hypothetical protein